VHYKQPKIIGGYMTFKPMLASHCKDTSKLKFPVLASKKLDGVRATAQGGVLLSRSLKQIPNVHVQEMFKGLQEGLDGELIFGDPCSPTAYRDTVSIVMSDDKPAEGIQFWAFDKFSGLPFVDRLADVRSFVGGYVSRIPNVQIVKQTSIEDVSDLDTFEADALAEGNEGVMIRSLDGPYKQGRSSEKEAYLLKLKRFEDSEAVVIGTYELMHNDNEAFTNELGRTARSTEKAGKVGLDTLGGFYVRGSAGQPFDGVEFKVGNGQGMTQELRKQLWADRESLIGRTIKIKYFPTGGKDRPRHPLWLGWRDERDLS
jgi:DNA ligase 1